MCVTKREFGNEERAAGEGNPGNLARDHGGGEKARAIHVLLAGMLGFAAGLADATFSSCD